jgi:hypothetical protein
MSVLTASPAAPTQTDKPASFGRHEWPIALLAIAVFSLLSITMALLSIGFLEGDACSHFLTAQAAFSNPAYLVNVWGRPVCTGLYCIPAHFGGRTAVRLTSLVVAILIALITRSIAVGQGWRWPTLSMLFLLAQPLVFLHSFSELTELPFALLMALGFWAYQRRQFFLLALVMGLGPLSRPEGFGFLALTALALLLHRRWWWTAVLLSPLLLWDYFGWRLNGYPGHWWMWLHDNWPYSEQSLYEKGPLLYFVGVLPAVVSPLLFPATVIGGWLCLTGPMKRIQEPRGLWSLVFPADSLSRLPARSQGWTFGLGHWAFIRGFGLRHCFGIRNSTLQGFPSEEIPNAESMNKSESPNECPNPNDQSRNRWPTGDHQCRCELLIAILPLMILVGHSLLYWQGKMASNGEVRYMMVVAPFWALLSARGWTWIFRQMDWKQPFLWAALACMLPVLVNRAWTVLPMGSGRDWVEARQIADWYKSDPIHDRFPYLDISHVGLQFALGFNPESGKLRPFTKSVIAARPPGTLLIWDRIGAMFNSNANRKVELEEIRKAGWREIPTRWTVKPQDPADRRRVSEGGAEWHFFESDPVP